MSSELLDLACRVAIKAGEVLVRRHDAGAITYKTSDTDPVSEADRASERLITGALLEARPDDGMLGEEGADRRGSSGLRWVIDPLDGTVNFLYGMPAWSVSIACEDDQGAVVGVVHQPATGQLYRAVRGGGSFGTQVAGGGAAGSERRLKVNDPVPLSHALIATGFAYDVENRTRQAGTVSRLLPQIRDIRRIGSAALDLCTLAAGMVDGYYEDTTHRWDWAAGALIAAEAGATVQVRGNGIAAAGPALFDELVVALDDPGAAP